MRAVGWIALGVGIALVAGIGWPRGLRMTTESKLRAESGKEESGPVLEGRGSVAGTIESKATDPERAASNDPWLSEGGTSTPRTPLSAPATLEVRVLGWMRRPVADASVALVESDEVEVRHEPVLTDREGRVRFAGVVRPAASVTVTSRGHEEQPVGVELVAGTTTSVDVVLTVHARVEGRVVDHVHGRPLAGVTVHTRDGDLRSLYCPDRCRMEVFKDSKGIVTDEGGTFVLEGLRLRDSYTVWAQAPGYDLGEQVLKVNVPDAPPSLELRLHRSASVILRLRDGAGAATEGVALQLVPVELAEPTVAWDFDEDEDVVFDAFLLEDNLEAEVASPWDSFICGSWLGPGCLPVHAGRTDEQGFLRLDGLTVGRAYRVEQVTSWVGLPGTLSGDTVLVPTAVAPEVLVDLRLQDHATLRLRCTDPEGRPLDGISVRVNGGWLSLQPDDAGVARAEVASGAMTVQVKREGFQTAEFVLDAPAGAVVERDVHLLPGVVLEGRLLDEAGLPFARGNVSTPQGSVGQQVTVDADGRFQFTGLQPGRVRLDFRSPDSRQVGKTYVTAPANGVRLTLVRAKRIPATIAIRWPEGFVPDEKETWWWVREVMPDGTTGFAESPANEDGNRKRYELFPGAHEACVHHNGCTVLRYRFEIAGSQAVDLGTIEPRFRPPAEGRVVYADGGPVPHAVVNLRGYSQVTADGEGRFTIGCAPEGSMTAVVGGPNVPASIVELPAPAAGVPWRIVVGQGGLLRGHIPGGAKDVRVAIESLDRVRHAPLDPPDLDTAARFLVRIAPGSYRVSALRGGAVLSTTDAHVSEGETTDVALRLP